MLPRTTSLSSRLPSIHVRPQVITISSRLSIDITTVQRLFETLGPTANELVGFYCCYGDIPYRDQCTIYVLSIKEVWRSKDRLREDRPGSFIVGTILRNVQAYCEKKGWIDKWEQIGVHMRRLTEEYDSLFNPAL
jgi:hypothetical protein